MSARHGFGGSALCGVGSRWILRVCHIVRVSRASAQDYRDERIVDSLGVHMYFRGDSARCKRNAKCRPVQCEGRDEVGFVREVRLCSVESSPGKECWRGRELARIQR